MRPLSARERRLVALGLLFLAMGLVWLILVGPLVGGFVDRDAQRKQLELTLQRNERLMAAISVWRSAAEAQQKSAPRFAIAAPSEQLAVEALKERLTKLATDEGFTLTGVEDLQADAAAGRVEIRADMTLSLTDSTDIVRRLNNEGGLCRCPTPHLSISADRAAAAGRSAPMDTRLDLSADWRPVRPRPS